METRANHVLIGSFVLVFLAALALFVVWISKLQVDREYAYYDVLFSDSVSGLGEGGDVRFNGIKVGSVDRIVIDRVDPAKVKVTLSLDADTPVRQNSFAQLELQGITGVSYVQISGGTADSPIIPGSGSRSGEHPVIPARPSKIAELIQAAPELLARSADLLERANALLSQQNEQSITEILANLKTVTGALAGREKALTATLDNLERASGTAEDMMRGVRDAVARFNDLAASADKTLASARTTFGHVDNVLAKDIPPLIDETRKTAATLAKLSNEIQDVIADNREPLHAFTREGVPEFRQFMGDARILIDSLSRLANRLEEDPSRLLFGTRESEFKADGR
jgi:phospholipid/cholesterol/gamma-HCH transport system substrate-binding protein